MAKRRVATKSFGRRRGSTAGARRGATAGAKQQTDLQSRSALRRGVEEARSVLEARRRRAARRPAEAARLARKPAGLLMAVGDSWFDYPFHDVLEELEARFAYETDSVAHRGDRVEEMVYDRGPLDRLAYRFEKLVQAERRPKAILLSAGGNDIAGHALAVLLNHSRSGLPPLSEAVVAGLIDERLRAAITSLAGAVSELARGILGTRPPILIHGYDYPVPDGRGYLGGLWLFPGPWLEPGFRRKGYLDLATRCRVMESLIDRFNAVLATIAGSPGLEHVRHVDLRGTLSNALRGRAYRAWWNDELHPSAKGFVAVARRFDRALRSRRV